MNNIQKAYERLHRKGTDEIVDYAYELEQQLQSYKEKEYKLREHCNHYLNDLLIIEVDKIPLQIVLQILNEGDK